MQNSIVMFSCSVFDLFSTYRFWANLVQKVKIVSLKLKFGTKFHHGFNFFFCFRPKIVSLSWNFVSKLIRICRIQWWCSMFSVLDRKYLFRENLVENIKIVSLNWNLVPRLIRICWIQWWCSLFLFLTGNTLFEQILSEKLWSFVHCEIWIPRLIRICRIQWWCSFFLWKYPFWNKFGQYIWSLSKLSV